jgi:carbon starvation protein
VLFGHHFAAIAGSGPLIGPVLAAQFGFLPGFLWLLIGVVLAGAVHDFVILTASVRYGGKSLAEIARHEISPLAGVAGSVAILIIVILALAGLGLTVVNALAESSWGTFTIAATIPIGMAVGIWMFRFRPGHIAEATYLGVAAVLGAVVLGAQVPGSSWAGSFTLSRHQITGALAAYGFLASVLPVWLLLCPRDYLSSYLKIGTIGFLVVGVIWVHPNLQMPMVTQWAHGEGPIIKGKLFPYVFITIACGAISGFHSLVSSGTTPKMLDKETDARMIGYGAMLVEGLVGIVALLASCALNPADYFAINVPPAVFAHLGLTPVNLDALSAQVGESLAGRTGGAVSLAVGFTQIFSGFPFMKTLAAYWYHFAIMFEALFILTTIDAGTRVARFLVQEFGGKVWPTFGRQDWIPGTLVSTLAVVAAWGWFIWVGSIGTIWPMFGTANQLLAAVALAVGTSVIINAGKVRYAWTTFVPMLFVALTTLWACVLNILDNFLPLTMDPATESRGYVNILLTLVIMICAVVVLFESVKRWWRVLVLKQTPGKGHLSYGPDRSTTTFRCC